MDIIKVEGMRFIDEHGRERIFSGMNVVDKKDYDEKTIITISKLIYFLLL